MFLIYIIILLDTLIYYTSNKSLSCTYYQAEIAIISLFSWMYLRNNKISKSNIFSLITAHVIFISIIDWKIKYVPPAIFYMYNTLLLIIGYLLSKKKFINSDDINKKNINMLFYKPKTLKQTIYGWLGEPVSSFGMIINNRLYQARHKKKTIQEIRYYDKYIKDKYIILDTGISSDIVTNEDIELLLNQRARQMKTLWLRLNCLRSFRHILNKMGGYEYKGDIFPSIYLRRIKRDRKR